MTRSQMMAGIGGKDTAPEMILRRGLHARGYRFRLHGPGLPGRPDLVLPRWRVVIFAHGCFWHAHEGCRNFRIPATRTDFWTAKLMGNRARDLDRIDQLRAAGWRVLVVWECATRALSRDALLDQVEAFVTGSAAIGELVAPSPGVGPGPAAA